MDPKKRKETAEELLERKDFVTSRKKVDYESFMNGVMDLEISLRKILKKKGVDPSGRTVSSMIRRLLNRRLITSKLGNTVSMIFDYRNFTKHSGKEKVDEAMLILLDETLKELKQRFNIR